MQSKSNILLVLFVTGLLSFVSQTAYSQKDFMTIVLDPGHGGKDPGAMGRKLKEKNVVLDVAQRVGKMLHDSIPDLKVVFTRDSDVFIPLDERAEIANKNNANLFVSIHANASPNKAVFGAETYVLGLHRTKENLEVAQKENSVITLEDDYSNKYEGFDPSQPESYIMFELMQNVYLEQSILMASLVQSSMCKNGRKDRGVLQAGFLVLRKTSMPSILVELGYISNADEEKYLGSEEGCKQLAYSIFKSISAYKNLYGPKSSVAIKKVEKQQKPKFKMDTTSVNYRIQIAAWGAPQPSMDTISCGPVSVIKEDGKYKYMLGCFKTQEEATEYMKEIRKRFADSFMVAFDKNEKISIRAARRRQKK